MRRVRFPVPLKPLTWLAACGLRLHLGTLRVRTVYAHEELSPLVARAGYIYCLWHETMLLPAHLFRGRGIHVLISQSRDGEHITRVVEGLGFKAVRGSSTRGAVKAVRALARASMRTNLAITPDGPRGPRHAFQPGAVYLASRTGLPLVPVGCAFGNAWRADSWDRFVLPKPFSRATCYFGPPLSVPADCDAQSLEHYQELAHQAMQLATGEAERMLAGVEPFG